MVNQILYYLTGLRLFLRMSVLFLLPIYLTDIGLSGVQQGIVLSVLTITALLTTTITGIGNDRISTKRFIIFGFLLAATHFYGLGVYKNFNIIFILFFLGGIGSNLVATSMMSMIYKKHEENKKGSTFGNYWFYSSFFSGSGLLIGAYLIKLYSFPVVFKLIGICYIVLAFFSFILKDTIPSEIQVTQYSGDLFKKDILFLTFILYLFAFHWGAETTSYGLFLKNNLNLSHMHLAFYMAIPMFVLSLTARKLGCYIDNYGDDGRIFISGIFLSGVGHILMIYPEVSVSFVFRLVHEMGDGIVGVFTYVKMSQLFSRSRIGGNTGFVTTIMVLGHFSGTLVFAPLGAEMGSHISLLVSGTITVIASILAVYSSIINPDHCGKISSLWKGLVDLLNSINMSKKNNNGKEPE